MQSFAHRKSPSGPLCFNEMPFYGIIPVSGSVVFVGPQLIAPGVASDAPLFGDFFALMPGDNAATIAAGAAVLFPQNGEANGIVRSSSSQILLPEVGFYLVSFQVSVTEAGQLVLGLDEGAGVVELPFSVAGRATGTSLITNTVIVETTVANAVLTVRNASGNPAALTITPIAGGTHSVSAHLTVLGLAAGAGTGGPESSFQFRIPAKGTLDGLVVQNNPVGADAVLTTYRVRKNGVNVGTPLVLANNSATTVRLNLKTVSVLEGDLISITATSPVFAGLAPVARVLLGWLPKP